MEVDVSYIFKSLLYFTRSVKWDIVYEDKSLFIKARNDLGLNEFQELVCTVGKEYENHKVWKDL
jgi:hypothetical protein